MTPAQIREALPYLTPKEQAELQALLAQDVAAVAWRALPGPQQRVEASEADIIGFGGAAGGGKTDLICGQVSTKHYRSLVVRREKAQTEGIVQRLMAIRGGSSGLNSQKGIWRLDDERLLELAGLDDPGDERRWQGRDHDLKAFDEVTEMREHQVRFVMGWNRTARADVKPKVLMTFNPPTTTEGRWVLSFFGPWLDKKHPLYPTPPGVLRWCAMLPDKDGNTRDQWVEDGRQFVLVDGKPCYEFDSSKYTPEQIIQPKSRTFIPARVTDNPYYMASGYIATLQAMPEPLRSQMLYGDFHAGISDDPWQVIPTTWVEAAQKRWVPRSPRGEMLGMGVDVARGGKDKTVISTKHAASKDGGLWFDELVVAPGKETPDGEAVAGLVVAKWRDAAPIMIDVIGVGASPYDLLKNTHPAVGVNVAIKSTGRDKSGLLGFSNLRSEIIWKFREMLDPQNDCGVALPPDPELLQHLCAFKWRKQGAMIYVSSREEVIEEIGVSPDKASAVFLAAMDVPKVRNMQTTTGRETVLGYDPMTGTGMQSAGGGGHDPMAF